MEDQGIFLESNECPFCGHSPVWKEAMSFHRSIEIKTHSYYCHSCGRGFDKPNVIGTMEYNRRHGKL